MINQVLFKQTFCLNYENLKTIRHWLLDAGIESPKEICETLNQQLIAAPNNRHLICLMIMIIDKNNTVHIYNAGMPAALQLSHDKSIHLEENMGLLGINTQLTIEPKLITLTKDVSLHCYSDGLANHPITINQINRLTHYQAKERHMKIWQNPQRSAIDDKTLISIYR